MFPDFLVIISPWASITIWPLFDGGVHLSDNSEFAFVYKSSKQKRIAIFVEDEKSKIITSHVYFFVDFESLR